MKKVKFANFDNIENVINNVVNEFPFAKVECVFGITGNGLGLVIDTGETNEKADQGITPCEYSVSTVEKLPTVTKAKEKTFYILSAADGERTAGTVWEKIDSDFISKTIINVIGA